MSLVTPKLGICPRCLFFCYSITLRALPNIRYRNPITSVFGYLIYTNRLTDNNLIYGTRLTAKGVAENYALDLFNRSKLQTLMMQVGKYIETLKIQVSLEYQLMLSERRQIINGIAVPVANQNNTLGQE